MTEITNLERISHKVWKMYPEIRGVQPDIRYLSGASPKSPAYSLTYHSSVSIQGGRQLSRWIKVSVSNAGEILKISSSK